MRRQRCTRAFDRRKPQTNWGIGGSSAIDQNIEIPSFNRNNNQNIRGIDGGIDGMVKPTVGNRMTKVDDRLMLSDK